MKIEDVMTRRVVAARADTDLAHVARLMWDNDCGSVPVVDAEDKVVGILTDRDVCMSAHFTGKALRELRASSCMNADVVTCLTSDGLGAAVQLMGERRIRRLAVTDEAGRLVGIVSVGDLLNAADRADGKEQKKVHAALVEALTAITARPPREEVEAALPSKRSASKKSGTRSGTKKRAKV